MPGGGGLDNNFGTGMDFFPNDLLMPTDGSWFFPPTNMGGTGTGGMGSGSETGNVPGMEGGMGHDTWMNTTGMGFGYSMGAGQNVDWGFGGTGTGTGTGTNEEAKKDGV